MHVWSITCLPADLEDSIEKLADLDPLRLVITRIPGRLRQTIQYFCETATEATDVQKKQGGEVAEVSDAWKTPPLPHPPIRIRDRFLIVESLSTPSDPRQIAIPAGLAFGTGDHPTTASCLRLLCDVAAAFGPKKWTLLDVGTGSGLIAIAAKKLGARAVAGFDYDPFSIRTARENARLNAVAGIVWNQQDLLSYQAEACYEVVAANIFSELFLATWPRIFPALAAEGYFILSGILRFQAEECRKAIQDVGCVVQREIRLGKWVTFLAQRTSEA